MTTQPLSALTMLLSRHTRRREFITLLVPRISLPKTRQAPPDQRRVACCAPARCPLNNYFLPGTRYAFCALEALSAIALNSAPVQALAVVTSEIVPAAAAASNEAMMFSASLHSEMSRKSESPVVNKSLELSPRLLLPVSAQLALGPPVQQASPWHNCG